MEPIPRHFTVATYNIRHGRDADFQWNRLADPMAACHVDIVCLQEVDMGTRRVQGQNTVAAMKKASGLPHAVFAPAMRYDGGEYGLAVLTRFPILSHELCALPTPLGAEPRICLHIRLQVEGMELHILTTHLSYGRQAVRQKQFSVLQTLLPTHAPFVLTGDLNTADIREISVILTDDRAMVNSLDRPLMTFREPPAAIDHMVYTTQWLALKDHGMIDSSLSDHNLLWGNFIFNM